MYEDDPINKFKMTKALIRMSKNHSGNLKITSHEFEFIKKLQTKLNSSAEGKEITSKLTKEAMTKMTPEEKLRMKQRISEGQKGSFWWTNGISNHFCKTCPGEGWYRGRTFNYVLPPVKKGKDHPLFGKKRSDETKAKMSAALKGKNHLLSEETRKKLSAALMGNKHLLGHVHSEETRKLISEREKAKDLHWFTDGNTNVKATECPEGFRKGRRCPWADKKEK